MKHTEQMLKPATGAYHSGIPDSRYINQTDVSGCALAIADVEDIELVTMDVGASTPRALVPTLRNF